MIFAGKKQSFTIQIIADSVKVTNQPNWILVDSAVLQVSAIPIPEGVNGDKLSIDRQKEVLSGYVEYETDYFLKDLKLDITNLKREWYILNGKPFLLWYFDIQQRKEIEAGINHKRVIRQVYLSTIWHDQVLDFNNDLINSENMGKAKDLLFSTSKSIKSYEGKFDFSLLTNKK